MKIGLDAGHMPNGFDTGAQSRDGSQKEENYTYGLARLIESKLLDLGHYPIWCRPPQATNISDSLRQRVEKANICDVQLFVSLHFNALNSKAYGTEIWISKHASKTSHAIANNVLTEIRTNTNFTNRGIKKGNFYVLSKTKMPAILIECCFIDNIADMRNYNAETMAKSIVSGLVGESPATDVRNESVTLKVHKYTILKKSTKQYSDLAKEEFRYIKEDSYQVSWLASEEKHYLIELNGEQWFIYSEHCTISDD